MQQRSVGATGLKVSRLGLGTMTWGRDTDEHEARDQLIAFAEAGGTLLDTAAGYGCLLNLPEGGTGFTTIELKTNFVRSAREGTISCEARLVHGGRTTQLWDATVSDAEGRLMALFRCTQLVLRAG